MNSNICFAVNYLLFTDSTRQMWTSLARHLEEFELRLVLLSTAEAPANLPFPVIHVPFFMREYATQFPGACRDGGTYSARDWELLQADSARAQNAFSPAESIAGFVACRNVMKSLIETLQPSFVMTWDSTSPIANIISALCHEVGLPVQSLERGLLPETLMLESRGIQAQSDLRTNWLAQAMPASDNESWTRLRTFYLNRKPQKYAQLEFNGGGAQLREELKLGNKKAVVFLGHFDPCGLAPADSNQRRYNSPAFRSTEDLLMNLSPLLKNSTENVLIFKPHPLDRNPYEAAKAAGARIVTDVNVHALIDLADIVVAQFTTLQFEAALYDKPVVLAARSAWWGRNATYEVARREDLPIVLLSALQRENWNERSANARAFLSSIMENWLISCGTGVPARRNLSDLAKFIAANDLGYEGSTAWEQRLAAAQNQFNQWRGVTRTETTPPNADESIEALRSYAESLCRLGSWEQASEVYRALSNQLPDSLEICQARLNCALKSGQKFVAGLLRGDALRAHPEWIDYLPEVTPRRAPRKLVPTPAS